MSAPVASPAATTRPAAGAAARTTTSISPIRWVLRRRLGLVLGSLALMAIGPYLGSVPIRALPEVIALARGTPVRGELVALFGERALDLPFALGVLVAIGALSFVIALVAVRVSATLSARAAVDLRLLVHERLLERPPDVLRAGGANQVRTALLEQSRVVSAFATTTLPAVLGVVFAIVIWGGTLWTTLASSDRAGAATAIVAGVVAIMVFVNGGLAILAGRRTREIQGTIVKAHGELVSLSGESVDHVGDLQLHGAQAAQQARFAALLHRMADGEIRVAWWSGFATSASNGLLLFAIPLAVLAWRALALDPAQLAVMIPALMMLQRSVAGLGSLWTSYRVAKPAIDLVTTVIAAEPTVVDPPAAKTLGRVRGAVTYEHVAWSAKDRRILADVSLSVEPGETVALVGRGGSGKSTLLSMLVRVTSPERGRILLDGEDIASVARTDLRKRVVLIDQHPALFARSIRENLLLDGATVDDSRILALADRVQAREVIANAGGLDRQLAARSDTLSGSERRRLALVRALLRDPDVLLVDELEAGLPQAMAQQLFDSLRELTAGKTCLVVTHRPDLLKTDRIAFVHDGKIYAVGTHDELARTCAPYRDLLAETADKSKPQT